ncbi:MAG: ion channel [Chitinophagales bacterium]
MRLSAIFSARFQNQLKSDEFGYTSKYDERNSRVINKDGTFNVKRVGEKKLIFHNLMTMSWWRFALFILFCYISINLLFASLYYFIDPNGIGTTADFEMKHKFVIALFFSAQTLTTVGYGSLYPLDGTVSFISSTEALFGLMGFAIFTGLMYGRFSRPVHGVRFSKNALIAPYKNGWSFQFRLANEMSNNLMELEARALLSIVLTENGNSIRRYLPLSLENPKVSYIPLNWTCVHAIDEKSPLWNMTEKDFADGNAEVLVMVKGFNDTFGQEIHARSSYSFDEILWNKKYQLPYYFAETGRTVFELDKLDAFEEAPSVSMN